MRRARTSALSRSSPARRSTSARLATSRSTGTNSPSGVSTAMPRSTRLSTRRPRAWGSYQTLRAGSARHAATMARISRRVTSPPGYQAPMSASSVTVTSATSAWAWAMARAMARRGPRRAPTGPASASPPATRPTSAPAMSPSGPLGASPPRATSPRRAGARAAGLPRTPAPPAAMGAGASRTVPPPLRTTPATVPLSARAGAGGAVASPSSKPTRGAPTGWIAPGAANSLATVPSQGAGISTMALAVSTATIGSPALRLAPLATYHSRISASLSPSPRSGRLNSFMAAPSAELQGLPDGGDDPRHVGDIGLFVAVKGHHRVVARHPPHRRQQARQPRLGEHGGHLGPEAGGAGRLVDDDATPGFRHRVEQGGAVEGFQGGDIDHLGADALRRQQLRPRQAVEHRRAPAHQADVAAVPQHVGGIEGQGRAVVRHLLPDQ